MLSKVNKGLRRIIKLTVLTNSRSKYYDETIINKGFKNSQKKLQIEFNSGAVKINCNEWTIFLNVESVG